MRKVLHSNFCLDHPPWQFMKNGGSAAWGAKGFDVFTLYRTLGTPDSRSSR